VRSVHCASREYQENIKRISREYQENIKRISREYQENIKSHCVFVLSERGDLSEPISTRENLL
jgi:hypothetical protein